VSPGTVEDGIRCCRERRPTTVRELTSRARSHLSIERCSSCGAHWLYGTSEIAMSWDSELSSYAWSLLSTQEAAALPSTPTDDDLAFLADRDVLVSLLEQAPVWRKGWPRDL
jgi:hypothetical protein